MRDATVDAPCSTPFFPRPPIPAPMDISPDRPTETGITDCAQARADEVRAALIGCPVGRADLDCGDERIA